MQLGVEANVVVIPDSVDGGQQRFDIHFLVRSLGCHGEAQAGNHFAVQGAVILLRLLLEFEVKAIRQILDGNRRQNKKTITQPFWLSGGGLQHFFERLTNHPVVAPRLPCCISLQGRGLWRRMIRYLRRPNRPLHQRISRNLLGNK